MPGIKGLTIAIDGPAGAGKSTIARLLAQKLGYIYIDTGAMYRAVTLKALEYNLEDEEELQELARELDLQFVHLEGKPNRVLLDGDDITEELRSQAVEDWVSIVASYPAVRRELVKQQKKLARDGGVVIDGRDIGTVVLPDADLKIFLTASLEERAYRRWQERSEKGEQVNIEQVRDEMMRRDKLDTSREVSPLKKAEDAIEVDTTNLSEQEVVDEIIEWC
ncbi:MAG: (d)CMP kinase [Halanaerobium sp.]|nr:(d)CMP kinase [Halanaerobium sp.]